MTNLYEVRKENNSWVVRIKDKTQTKKPVPLRIFSTQKEAIQEAKKDIKSRGTIVIHSANGEIREVQSINRSNSNLFRHAKSTKKNRERIRKAIAESLSKDTEGENA